MYLSDLMRSRNFSFARMVRIIDRQEEEDDEDDEEEDEDEEMEEGGGGGLFSSFSSVSVVFSSLLVYLSWSLTYDSRVRGICFRNCSPVVRFSSPVSWSKYQSINCFRTLVLGMVLFGGDDGGGLGCGGIREEYVLTPPRWDAYSRDIYHYQRILIIIRENSSANKSFGSYNSIKTRYYPVKGEMWTFRPSAVETEVLGGVQPTDFRPNPTVGRTI